MKKKSVAQKAIQNFVAKFAAKFNKSQTFRNKKLDYMRKQKHKGDNC